jgi:hypothetical protein
MILRHLFAIFFIAIASLANAQDHPAPHAIGVEEGQKVVLERGDYVVRPLDDRTPVILRLGKTEAVDGGFAYQLHVIGFEPGEHRLADYLMHPDGSPATELGDRTFTVKTVLPPEHDGTLTPHLAAPMPWFGGYRHLLIGLAVLWVLGWFGIHRIGRQKKRLAEAAPEPPPPGFAERLRPYLERAAGGKLDADGKAELERLLLSYWRDRLSPPGETMAAEFAALRAHPEASPALDALERWLHRPGGADARAIESLLDFYRNAESGKEARA